MLRQEGVAGIIEFPGPQEIFSKEGIANGYTKEVYLAHAKALMDGFEKGINPGHLTEICGDSMDNDGDMQIDEGC
ncbi:MAG: hypothetical protein PHH08_00430 [Candidatus ainarchaeum sp.]|nr:hypothetical protein [Candidatus ainarchaeum sp.]